MRLSVLLSAAVLSFLFLLPQQGVSQPAFAQQQPQSGVAVPPMPENFYAMYLQYELARAANYLADLQKQYDAAKARGDKSELRRFKSELKRMLKIVNATKKAFEKEEKKIIGAIGFQQLDYLCAMGQNPGSCRKCENGRVVIDDSQSPGKCMICVNGQAAYDNSYLSSCKRCLNGKVVAMNGKTCKPSTECMEYTCQQGRCQGSPIYNPSDDDVCLADR